jgi:hypothetical protein
MAWLLQFFSRLEWFLLTLCSDVAFIMSESQFLTCESGHVGSVRFCREIFCCTLGSYTATLQCASSDVSRDSPDSQTSYRTRSILDFLEDELFADAGSMLPFGRNSARNPHNDMVSPQYGSSYEYPVIVCAWKTSGTNDMEISWFANPNFSAFWLPLQSAWFRSVQLFSNSQKILDYWPENDKDKSWRSERFLVVL